MNRNVSICNFRKQNEMQTQACHHLSKQPDIVQ